MRAFSASTAALAALLSTTVAAAKWSANSDSNVAVYWGQGGGQNDLESVCNNPSIDTVILSFITKFPTKVGGYPSSDFGNACWADRYVQDGVETGLFKTCLGIGPGIAKCHENGKKVFLSLGGETSTDPITDPEVAKYFAEFLWGAFGPSTAAPPASWVAAGSPRPFVGKNGEAVSIDGIDFDIEKGGPTGYDVMINHFKNNLIGNKEFYFSAAPQCLTDDAQLGEVIKKASFDMLFVQFYNTPMCSAKTGWKELDSGRGNAFTFGAWVDWVKQHSKNPDVKIYLGLHASIYGSNDESYITPIQAQQLAKSLKSKYSSHFGGVMLWQASSNDQFETAKCGKDYAYYVKKAITAGSIDSAMTCPTTSSTIASSTSSSQTTSTTSQITTTAKSSTLVSTTSTSQVTSSTSTSTTSQITTTAKSSTLVSTTSTSQVTSSTSTQPISTSLSSSARSTTSSSTAESTQASSTAGSTTASSTAGSTTASSTAESTQVSSTAESIQASSTAESTQASSTVESTQASTTAESTQGSSTAESTQASRTTGSTTASSTAESTQVSSTAESTQVSSTAESTQVSSTAESTQASSTAESTQASSTAEPTQASSTAESTQVSSTAESTQASSTAESTQVSSTAEFTLVSSTTESTQAPHTTETSITTLQSDTGISFPTITPTGPWSNITISSQAVPTTTVIITSYVDICPTGLVTVPVTITSTICTACPEQTATAPSIPTGWTTTVTVCTVCGATPTTVTLTKPIVEVTPTSVIAEVTPVAVAEVTPVVVAEVTPVVVAEEPVERTTLTHITRVYTKVLTKTQSNGEPMATPSVISSVVTFIHIPIKSFNGTGYAHPTGNAHSTGYAHPTGGSPIPTSQPPAFTGAASKTTVSVGMLAGLVVALLAL